MAQPIFTINDAFDGVRILKFEIPGGVTSPEEFAAAVDADLKGKLAGERVLLVNGRGPVWGFGMILHEGHPTPACATYDPRLGYIVCATHTEAFKNGDAIPDPEAS
jgi:CRISPR-associated protein Csx3